MITRSCLVVLACLTGLVSAHAETTLKVGSTPTGVPFTFLDPKTNTIQGMMVDVIEEVGRDAGFKPEIQAMQFSALIPSLTSGKIDIVAAAISASPERAKVIDFGQSIYEYGDGIVVPATDKRDYTGVADLKGKKVGAQIGTRYLDALKASNMPSEVVAYDSIPDIMRDVANGRLDVGVGDSPILGYNLAQGRFPQLRLVTSYKPVSFGPVNIAVQKGNTALLTSIDASITRMKADGRLQAILKKWGL